MGKSWSPTILLFQFTSTKIRNNRWRFSFVWWFHQIKPKATNLTKPISSIYVLLWYWQYIKVHIFDHFKIEGRCTVTTKRHLKNTTTSWVRSCMGAIEKDTTSLWQSKCLILHVNLIVTTFMKDDDTKQRWNLFLQQAVVIHGQ